jgi:uncharacterized protein (DUF488 family)
MERSTLYSIGHGNKTLDAFLEELNHFKIDYLIDIRSKPYSKYNPQFNREQLMNSLKNSHIVYTYMGDVLGGLPEDPACYTDGHVDYNKLKEKDFFKNGLQRLINAANKEIKLAIMCSESNPAECHRTKLIGEELRKAGIIVNHITRSKDKSKRIITKDQLAVMMEVAPNGTTDLFGNNTSFTSRKKYNREEEIL